MKHAFLACLCAFLLMGCATTDELILDTTPRTPTTAVQVFKDGAKPDWNHKAIAELSYLGPREEELQAQRRFTKQAMALGGEAVILSVVQGGMKGGGGGGGLSTSFVFKGLVVVKAP